MANETSRLVIEVDSKSVPKANAELDAFTASAGKAEAANKKLGETSRATAATHAETAEAVSRAEEAASKYAETEAEAAARIHDMVQASLAAADASKAQAAAQAAAAAKNAEASAAQVAASKALADAQTRQMAAWTASRAPVVELEAILAKTTLTTAEVAQAEVLLDKAQASGVISAGELAAAFKALDAAKIKDVAVTKAQAAADKSALNSRTQYELGVLGGEIATGNTSRIKRSVPALLNASGLTTKLLSPVGLGITAVVASLALFGKAVVDREQDLLNFNKALASTGDFAGTTGAQLQGIAAMVGDQTHDYGNATKAVLALAQSGTVLGSDMQQMATTAVNMAYLTGQSVDSVVKELIKLQGDPTQAIAKATEAMGLLTAAQYNQIVETQQTQGVTAAAALAMKDLGEASDAARQKLVDNAGIVIKTWTNFKNMLGDIGRDIASIGATQSVGEQIASLQKQRNLAYTEAVGGGNPDPNKDPDVVSLNARIAALQMQQRSDAMFAAGQELANQGKQAHDKALAEALAATKQGTDGFVADAAAINKKRYEALVGIVDPSIRDRINAAYDQQIRDAVNRANAQYRGGSSGGVTHKSKTDPLAGLSNMVAGLTAKSLDVPGDTALTAYVQGVAKLVDEYDKAIAKGGDVTKATAEYNEGVKALAASLDKAKTAQENAIKAYKASVDAEIAARQQQIDLQIASVGLSQREIQQLQAKAAIQTEVARKIEQLNQARSQPGANVGFIDAEIAKQQASLPILLKQQDDLYSKMNALRGDWMTGVETSWNEYIDQGKDVAGMTANVFNDAFSGMENSMVNFVQTGKLSFKDLADSIISDLVRMETRILISQALTSILGGIANARGASISSNYMANGGSTYAASGVDWSVNLSGGRASGGPVAGGSLYEVAEGGKPEVLSSGGHTYLLMGAQDGYVTPASTSGTSPLGRAGGIGAAQTKGGGTTVIVENHSDSQAQVQQSKDGNGNDLIRVVVGAAMNEWNSQVQRGGQSYKTLQQVFGLNRRGVPVAG